MVVKVCQQDQIYHRSLPPRDLKFLPLSLRKPPHLLTSQLVNLDYQPLKMAQYGTDYLKQQK